MFNNIDEKGEQQMPTAKKSNYKPKQQTVDFGTAVARFWTKYVEFDGTAQRSEYWFVVLFSFLVNLPIWLITAVSREAGTFFSLLWSLAILIPGMALLSRRFHDAGFSAKWWWIPSVSIIGGLLFCSMLAAIADNAGNEEALMLVGGLGALLALALIGFAIFWFVVTLLPSKFKDNPFRK